MQGCGVSSHVPVLLEDAVDQLQVVADGIYVDGTFGRGGHAGEILQRLGSDGRLFALDRDPDAVNAGRILADSDPRLVIEQRNFGQLREFLEGHDVFGRVSGVLFDLGVSSPQLDDQHRGFSFRLEGSLDMRMNPAEGQSAADWLNSATEASIRKVLFQFGEERAAPRIAREICQRRTEQPIRTTGQLAALVEGVVRRKPGGKHPATKTFQAIRIYINRELEAIEQGLGQAIDALHTGGRLVVISFHSLEDRIVKRFMRDHARIDPALSRLPQVPESALPRLQLPLRAIRPDENEIEKNPRARSATLRVAERLR
ncbi:MAG: S-adenosyl-methyltransferase [Chromatiales bacterium]|jgi:16S rRNA (cytosine1402-N4)-methyltransferase|nr:S-adenosyl-methyltransferase [Chromatiales bacterium]